LLLHSSNETGHKQDKQDIRKRGHKGVNGAIDIAEKKGDIKGTNGTHKNTQGLINGSKG
jgi:hypothetical protein